MAAEAHHGGRLFYRITLNQRIQHNLTMITFMIQVMSGMPLKFPNAAWALPLIKLFGGPYMAGRIHRISGLVMFLTFLYILFYIIITTVIKGIKYFKVYPATSLGDRMVKIVKLIYNLPICPRAKDGRDIVAFLKYAFFLTDKHPEYDKFCWKEKFDFLAVFWGVPVFTISGLFLWFPSFWGNIGAPGWLFNALYIAHTEEAFLASMVIFIWHFYNAFWCPEKFPMNQLAFTGCLEEEHYAGEYAREYKRILLDEGSESPSIVITSEEEE